MTEPVPSSSGSAQKILKSQNAELLAQLPLLEEMTFISGPLSPVISKRFLTALAAKESQVLQKLHFSGKEAKIDTVAAKELARLRSLRTLKCQFADPLDIQLLSHLTELEYLSLIANETFDKISPGLLTVIKTCKKLTRINIYIEHKQTSSGAVNTTSPDICAILEASQDYIHIQINSGSVWFNRENKDLMKKTELRVEMSLFENENFAMEPLARLESVQHMIIKGHHETVSLREFFAALGRRNNHELQSLDMNSPLDFDETTELAKITSLTSFKGKFSDSRSFQHFLHLSDFNVKQRGIILRNIDFYKSTGFLYIRILRDDQGNDTDLNPLARLPNLRHVSIEGPFEEGSMHSFFGHVSIEGPFEKGSMHSFFGQLATWQADTLQELDAGYYEMSNNELREVCRMRSLRKLICRLSCAKNLEQLAQLPQLAELIVVTHEKGSLQNLLAKLADRECHTLEHLDVWGEGLTPEEVKAVSAISSLKRLQCAFCCT
ncbi:uncharacterized protein LOC117582257 [Drosophila guanche]|uniref:uncharacterized protein LOC117582257 n=1 Tax=Drosophila guanche TaxID=7266 RepID=UPI001472696D|nr:uncharacterized protein LOC117582257 [Drosophila guanche]